MRQGGVGVEEVFDQTPQPVYAFDEFGPPPLPPPPEYYYVRAILAALREAYFWRRSVKRRG